MKVKSIVSTLVVLVFCYASVASADPPIGVGSAEVLTDPDALYFVAWVDVSGNSTPVLPGGEGLVFVALDDVHLVYTNNPNGDTLLQSHGRLPLGESVMAYDFVTNQPLLASLADLDVACDALSLVFPEACRGKNAMVLLNFDTTGTLCVIGSAMSDHWRTTTTRSGITNSMCHVSP
jgi:hypothetical protein